MTQRAAATLTQWLQRFPNGSFDSYIFPHHSVQQVKGAASFTIICDVALNRPIESWHRAWRSALKNAGLEYRWHDLRHTFVTRLAENPEISEQTIRALAGHVSQQMLQRYSHIRRQAKQDAIIALEVQRQKSTQAGGTKMGTYAAENGAPATQTTEKIWLPPRDSNPDMLIQRQTNVDSRAFLEWPELSCKLLSFLRFSPGSAPKKHRPNIADNSGKQGKNK